MEERLLNKLKTFFLVSAGVILSATALAKLYSTLGSARVLDRADELTGVANRWLLFGVTAVELELQTLRTSYFTRAEIALKSSR